MSDIREIVTKAIVAKGKKLFSLEKVVRSEEKVYSVLGCWIINHDFSAKREDDTVYIEGTFEVNIWYSYQNNNKTDIIRETIKYNKDIKIKQIVKEYLKGSEDVLAKVLKHPTVDNAQIIDGAINLEISLEILSEIIGETTMQVTILKDSSIADPDFEDLDIEINEDFL